MTLEKALCGRLKVEEGFRVKPYFDCCAKPFRDCRCEPQGKLTIGHGRNLEDVDLSPFEAELILLNDVSRAVMRCRIAIDFFDRLDEARQVVLADMGFNMGIQRLLKFEKMLAAARLGDFRTAADEMLRSAWAGQVGARAIKLAEVMRTGVLG